MASRKAASKSPPLRAKRTAVRRAAPVVEEPSGSSPAVPFPVVAVGASAGGLAALSALLKALPPNSGMAFVLIQHLEPTHASALTGLLSKVTAMTVVEVSDGIPVQPNCVYVIPPNRSMTIRKGVLQLGPRAEISGPQHPIDDFCIALAEEQGNAAIGVVLSGTGSDGTYGLKAIKASGGVTFAQDPKTAQFDTMPMSAITAGSVDFVLSPRRIAAELTSIGGHPYLAEARDVPEGSELDRICLILRSATGVDFRLYKQATVRRRIARRMALHKISSLNKYAQILKQHPEEAQALSDDIFIHVTSFFRDPECFQALRKRVLSKFRTKRSPDEPIRIWVAGCSTGEEVYSIAMSLIEGLGEQANRTRIQIFGTDIQERAVDHARLGIYPESAVAGVSPARLKRFFVKADHGYQIQKFIRDLCVFARHDLARDPPFSRLDLVSCRNVLIYMGQALQKRILSIFQYALKPGGVLFLGSSESISDSFDIFTADDRKHRIFLRKPAAPPAHEYGFSESPAKKPDTAPAKAAPVSPVAVDFRKEAESILLNYYTPPALIVDRDLHIVHFQGDMSPYLAPATGQPSFHLLKMVRPELIVDLRTAINRARTQGAPVHRDNVRFEHRGQPAAVRLDVRPFRKRNGVKQDLLVVFQKLEPAILGDESESGEPAAGRKHTTEKTQRLDRELASTREQLRSMIAEHETAQEEMKAANEEILSSNEELQSTNEELETAKEELQSSNEELITLNDELQHRNTELNVLTHDLNNLLVGIEIPVLVLDADLRVRRFTPVAGALFNLIPGDIGRPFSNIASNLDVPDWKALFTEVTDQGRSIEREVADRNGHRFSLRLRPYKTDDNQIDGVLFVMLDTDLIYRARDEAQRSGDYARAIIETIHEALLVVDSEFRVRMVNHSFSHLFHVSPRDIEGESFFGSGPGQCNVPELRRLLEVSVSEGKVVKDFEVDQTFSEIGRRRLIVNAHRIDHLERILIAIDDATSRKQAQEELQALAANLMTAQEEERRRVSRELHDQICQQLASLAIDIGGMAAEEPPPARVQGRLKEIQARVVKASEEARHIAYELHSSVLDDLGLVASLRSLCKDFSDRAKDVKLKFSDAVLPPSLPRETASCLYRVAQQSLQNISEHANARHVSLTLALKNGNVVLTIADDGDGFDIEAVKGRGGLGLISMEERARLVNGRLSVISRRGRGTRVAIEVPTPPRGGVRPLGVTSG